MRWYSCWRGKGGRKEQALLGVRSELTYSLAIWKLYTLNEVFSYAEPQFPEMGIKIKVLVQFRACPVGPCAQEPSSAWVNGVAGWRERRHPSLMERRGKHL